MMGTVHRILDDVALMLSFLRFTGATGSAGPALCGEREEYELTKQMFIIVRASLCENCEWAERKILSGRSL